jgi:exonuclease III
LGNQCLEYCGGYPFGTGRMNCFAEELANFMCCFSDGCNQCKMTSIIRKQIKRDLTDKWFMITNINASSDRKVGVGAMIHCSLAKHVTDSAIQPPVGLDQTVWENAVDGRILQIKVSRQGFPLTWHFIGVYQQVAKSVNRTARTQVRNTLQESLTKARQDGHNVLIMGDFNAAPPDGCWGYATGSDTVQEDYTMETWIRDADRTEVF